MVEQFTDPSVSLAKVNAELSDYRALEGQFRERGWFLVESTFPRVVVLMTAPHLRPPSLVCGVALDYTNYDARPPSVRLVNPFTGEPYLAKDLPTSLPRVTQPAQGVPGAPPGMLIQQVQPLMQAASPDEIPFLCLAGVREYHDHPAHTGDAWELHRVTGAGRLVRILEIIWRYGVQPVSYNVNMVAQIGFKIDEVQS